MDNLELLKPSLQKRQKRRDKQLGKEVIECYRHCHAGIYKPQKGGYNNRIKKNNYAHAKKHESVKFMHNGGTKFFNDNLEPLIRYLNTHEGKNWNKVYSKLCTQLDKRTVPGLHVFNHLWDFVCLHVRLENKKVYHMRSGKWEELLSWEKWPRFYINPKTGQLCKARSNNEKKMSYG
jgi:hypothetical protein